MSSGVSGRCLERVSELTHYERNLGPPSDGGKLLLSTYFRNLSTDVFMGAILATPGQVLEKRKQEIYLIYYPLNFNLQLLLKHG